MTYSRDELLGLDDAHLLGRCRMDRFRATGPGGQHRNTTDSAVRVTLEGYHRISATAAESRSQHTNRKTALKRLRLEIAYTLRTDDPPAWSGQVRLNPKNPAYPSFIAVVLDALAQNGFRVSAAARALGLSTAQLDKALARDPRLWGYVNQQRHKLGLRPLKP